ncbi:MAG TPA: choice-of-anchor Q domain-containing protein, partial [Polyangiaceae bacterium]
PQGFLWLGSGSDHPGFVKASSQGAGDVLGDPLLAGPWAAPPATNLALTKTSPAVGAGVSLAAVTHDFLDAPRPAAGADIGAFQYGATAPGDSGVGPSGDGSVTAANDAGVGIDDGAGAGAGVTTGPDAGSSGPSSQSPDGGSGSAPSSGCSCSHGEVGGGRGTAPASGSIVAAAACLIARRARLRLRGAWRNASDPRSRPRTS